MHKNSFIGVAAILCAGVSATAQQNPTAGQIVERHIQALGGIENIHAIHSLVIRGMYHEGGLIAPGTPIVARNYMAFLRPYYQVIGDPEIKRPNLREGFDGSAWEYYGNPGIVMRTVGAAAAATRHTSEFLQDSLVDYAEKGTRIELQGMEKIADRNCYRIQVTLSDGFQKHLFIDPETFLIAADRISAPIHAFGAAITSETRFSDYQPVEGVWIARRSLVVEIATGRVLADSRKVTVEANTLHDVSIFSPQAYIRTPLQQFLEQLYAERADPVSAMYTYRIFRRAFPQVDTREGVEFVGYQMAKTKDYAAAIELLKANAMDYRASASAQYGLGRAYEAAGKPDAAAQAFQAALQIDPGFKKATDGLNALR